MTKYILFLFLLMSYVIGKSQTNSSNNFNLIQGIWAGVLNSETECLYKITKGTKSLGISFANQSSVSDFYLNESIEGFQNYKRGEIDSINIKILNQEGKYYTLIIDEDHISRDGWVKIDYCIIPNYFECDGELMSINGGRLVEYTKMRELPYEALDKLFKRGRLDKRDYIFEYLNLKVRAIKSSYCNIYSNPKGKVIGKLQMEQVVIILEENANWLKVKYSEDEIGWIKKTHVEF